MLNRVPLKAKSLSRYVRSMGEEPIARIEQLAKAFQGARVLHINATSYGGGVAEILATLVPLMKGVGIDADWQVMYGTDDFYNVTKAMHNALQGMDVGWTPQMEQIYMEQSIFNVSQLEADYDFIIIHDPQPAAFLGLVEEHSPSGRQGKWIWRCHIDTSTPFAPVADFLFPLITDYDESVFTMADYVPAEQDLPHVTMMAPTIDPISLKNVPLSAETIDAIFDSYGMDHSRPTMCQISRFDPWKDPLGVIDAYRLVREKVPDLQLILAGSMASDDPEGMHYLHRTEMHAAGDPDIFILTNAQQVGAIEVNAFQAGSDVVVQKSTREGFGLTVSEALWKRTPVVGGNVGGITLQIKNGENGFLVDSVEACADACVEILTNPRRSEMMGEIGHQIVRNNYVMTVELERWLQLFALLSS